MAKEKGGGLGGSATKTGSTVSSKPQPKPQTTTYDPLARYRDEVKKYGESGVVLPPEPIKVQAPAAPAPAPAATPPPAPVVNNTSGGIPTIAAAFAAASQPSAQQVAIQAAADAAKAQKLAADAAAALAAEQQRIAAAKSARPNTNWGSPYVAPVVAPRPQAPTVQAPTVSQPANKPNDWWDRIQESILGVPASQYPVAVQSGANGVQVTRTNVQPPVASGGGGSNFGGAPYLPMVTQPAPYIPPVNTPAAPWGTPVPPSYNPAPVATRTPLEAYQNMGGALPTIVPGATPVAPNYPTPTPRPTPTPPLEAYQGMPGPYVPLVTSNQRSVPVPVGVGPYQPTPGGGGGSGAGYTPPTAPYLPMVTTGAPTQVIPPSLADVYGPETMPYQRSVPVPAPVGVGDPYYTEAVMNVNAMGLPPTEVNIQAEIARLKLKGGSQQDTVYPPVQRGPNPYYDPRVTVGPNDPYYIEALTNLGLWGMSPSEWNIQQEIMRLKGESRGPSFGENMRTNEGLGRLLAATPNFWGLDPDVANRIPIAADNLRESGQLVTPESLFTESATIPIPHGPYEPSAPSRSQYYDPYYIEAQRNLLAKGVIVTEANTQEEIARLKQQIPLPESPPINPSDNQGGPERRSGATPTTQQPVTSQPVIGGEVMPPKTPFDPRYIVSERDDTYSPLPVTQPTGPAVPNRNAFTEKRADESDFQYIRRIVNAVDPAYGKMTEPQLKEAIQKDILTKSPADLIRMGYPSNFATTFGVEAKAVEEAAKSTTPGTGTTGTGTTGTGTTPKTSTGGGGGGGGGGGSGGTTAPAVVGEFPDVPQWYQDAFTGAMGDFATYYADTGINGGTKQALTDFQTFITVWSVKTGRYPTVEEASKIFAQYRIYLSNLGRKATFQDFLKFLNRYFAKAPAAPDISYLNLGEM